MLLDGVLRHRFRLHDICIILLHLLQLRSLHEELREEGAVEMLEQGSSTPVLESFYPVGFLSYLVNTRSRCGSSEAKWDRKPTG